MTTEPSPKRRLSILDHIAHIVRIISVPPLMVSTILTILLLYRPELFPKPSAFWLTQLFLALLPLLAYPLSYALPYLRQRGRNGQRSLAMYLSLLGYFSAVLYGCLANCTESLRIIHLTYLLSVLILLVLNKLIHIRASGHACSISGPILLLSLYVGPVGVVSGILLWALIFWASIRIGRHTKKEYLLGSCVPILAYALSLLIYIAV